MRILSFSREWIDYRVGKQKVECDQFSTWRLERKDAANGLDWAVGEKVQVFYNNRSKNRRYVCLAVIEEKSPRSLMSPSDVTDDEARADGFLNNYKMFEEFQKMHKKEFKEHGGVKLIYRYILRRLPEPEV